MEEDIKLETYKTLSVQKRQFKNININDPFFDSLKNDYPEFKEWFARKSEKEAYVLTCDDKLLAFLFLKIETTAERYDDIIPSFPPKRRLKVGTFKVSLNGQRLGERFFKIIFDNAVVNNVDEIYVTIFNHTEDQKHLISMLKEWGFYEHGTNSRGEKVFARMLYKRFDRENPKNSYPVLDITNNVYITPIYPEFHTDLFPDSILNTESPIDYVENDPHRNAIEKIFISKSVERNLNIGDSIFFYRTKEKDKSAHYSAVVTTVGLITEIIKDITDENKFIELCKNRTVFTEFQLRNYWRRSSPKPFLVKFLHIESLKKRPNRKILIDENFPSMCNGPRGFVKLTEYEIEKLIELSQFDKRKIAR